MQDLHWTKRSLAGKPPLPRPHVSLLRILLAELQSGPRPSPWERRRELPAWWVQGKGLDGAVQTPFPEPARPLRGPPAQVALSHTEGAALLMSETSETPHGWSAVLPVNLCMSNAHQSLHWSQNWVIRKGISQPSIFPIPGINKF